MASQGGCASCARVAHVVVLALLIAPVSAANWTNITVYHTNQANYSADDIANMNTADDLGDLEFTIRAKMIPIVCADPTYARHAAYDCANPEQDATDLAITKLVLRVDMDKVGGYCPCNVHAGVYSCGGYGSHGSGCAGFGAISVGKFLGRFYNASKYNASTSAYTWFGANTLARFGAGMWYSTTAEQQCTINNPTNCSWRVAEVVKRVARSCSDAVQEAAVFSVPSAKKCLGGCPQPGNRSSACWVQCFYTSVFGRASAHSLAKPDEGLNLQTIRSAWAAPFLSDDPQHGGCPSI